MWSASTAMPTGEERPCTSVAVVPPLLGTLRNVPSAFDQYTLFASSTRVPGGVNSVDTTKAAHVPLLQLPIGQLRAHEPQLFWSMDRSTHVPAHQASPPSHCASASSMAGVSDSLAASVVSMEPSPRKLGASTLADPS